MSTNNDIIRDALGLIGVLSEVESLSAEQASHGLRTLNDMLYAWEVDGLAAEYYPQTDVNDEFPVDDVACVKYNLAIELAPYYERQPSMAVLAKATQYYQQKLRNHVRDTMSEQDVTHISLGTGHWQWKDITQG